MATESMESVLVRLRDLLLDKDRIDFHEAETTVFQEKLKIVAIMTGRFKSYSFLTVKGVQHFPEKRKALSIIAK